MNNEDQGTTNMRREENERENLKRIGWSESKIDHHLQREAARQEGGGEAGQSAEEELATLKQSIADEKIWSEVREKFPNADINMVSQMIDQGQEHEAINRMAQTLQGHHNNGRDSTIAEVKNRTTQLYRDAKAKAEAEVVAAWGTPMTNGSFGGESGITMDEWRHKYAGTPRQAEMLEQVKFSAGNKAGAFIKKNRR